MNNIAYSKTITERTQYSDIPDVTEYEQMLPFLPPNREADILEIAAGAGDFLKFLSLNGYTNFRGVDSDAVAIELAKSRGFEKMFLADALEYLNGIEDESLDAIIMNNAVEHFDKATLLRLIGLIRNKLRNRGVFIGKTGNIENPLNLGLYLRDFTHEIGFTRNSLRQVLLMAGFKSEAVSIRDIRYRSKNVIRTVFIRLFGGTVAVSIRLLAKLMACRIDSMAKLIFCVARKE